MTTKPKKTELCKMKLSVRDRVLIPSFMPKEADIITLTLSKDIQEKLRLSQADQKKCKMKAVINKEKPSESGLKWDSDFDKTIEFTNAEMELMRTQVNDLDKRKKVTPELLDVCLKIRKV